MLDKFILKIVDFYYLLTCKRVKPKNAKKQVQQTLKKIDINPNYYKDLHYSFKKDEEVSMFAIKKDYTLLEFVPSIFKDTKSFMKNAISINPYALCYASKKLKNDRKLALYAVLKEPNVYKFLSKILQEDITILGMVEKKKSDLARRDILLFQNLQLEARHEDEDFIYNTIQKDASFIKKASAKLRNNRFFILDLVAKNPSVFKHVKREFKNDTDIVLAAITPRLYATKKEKQQSASMYKHVSDTLKANKDFVKHCLHVNPYVKKYAKG